MTIPPPPPPVPLPSFTPLLVPALPSFQETKEEARALLLAGAGEPLPSAVLRHQERVLDRVYDALDGTGKGQWLYVLEIAGPIPRVKIGRSENPRGRISTHAHDVNVFQYGLIDAHVTSPLDDLPSIARAEAEAHIGMGKRYKSISREMFRDADFAIATLLADVAVTIQLNRSEVAP